MSEIKKEQAVEQCEGCKRVQDGFCTTFSNPALKWRTDKCSMASHLKIEKETAAKVNPLKASRRKAAGR